ncbi:glycerol-3-phosphate ABC transporter ATP-binding protein [Blastopirellula marina]|uniref:Glycerol-3-phosphate ABC transporter ATP-binding protein n=1 Tax=Blastopirellula marina TaxID=124 RepID=A0A2S8FAP9_9BACT|nr:MULTISPECIES: sn-glycerol-3-phosphate ABC transporter ATP-binding protein UgpC [Pirellulaceae]PQO29235.1 glycerol-3-phosphate ABC transporter ATP-binding protein [Blastopirellula marina]RCS50428.1 sn-glycerol-3-phosphate ABC transporter ATP-binding protein UgpC [Bremerella cremea]
MAKVVLNQVSKRFSGSVAAVSELNLEVADQEFLVLVGPSGCGKTTSLRMIAGLEDVSGGEITIGDRNVTHVSPKDRDIAMVFQNYALYPHMTVRRNMSFGLQLRYGGNFVSRLWRRLRDAQSAAEREKQYQQIPTKVDQVAATLGISKLLDRYPRELSGGERQRVALGRAIVRQPAAFLFDEPLSNLDAKLRVEMRRELKELHRRLGATMIYVTHDQVEAMTLGDRIAVMDQGVLQQVGSPSEVYHKPANRFVASFLGTPGMNLLEGELVEENGQFQFRAFGVRLEVVANQRPELKPSSSRKIVLGVRPEDILLTEESSADCPHAGRGQVELVESLGDTGYVHIRLSGEAPGSAELPRITAKANGAVLNSNLEAGPVPMGFRAQSLHWFDVATGLRLSPAGRD